MRHLSPIFIGLALWGLTLNLFSNSFLADALAWIGEMVIWVGGVAILALGSVVWLVICIIASIALITWLEDLSGKHRD